jgi:hypothetical protein
MGLPKWLEYQDSFYQLAEKVRDGTVVPFLGAGMSVEAKFPDWKGLMKRLAGKAQAAIAAQVSEGKVTQGIDESDLLFAADFFRKVLGDEVFETEICDALAMNDDVRERISKSSNYAALAKLDFPCWLTTNFDLALEAALEIYGPKPCRSVDWSQEDDVNRFLMRAPNADGKSVCIHLHGTLGTRNSLIFTERDYQRRYWRSDLDRVKLFVIFTSYSVVTIGFSLTDHDFMSILREVKAKLSLSEPRHYALLDAPEDQIPSRLVAGGHAAELREKYGIAPVYFPRRDSDFSKLGTLLEVLQTVVNSGHRRGEAAEGDGLEECPDDPNRGRWGGKSERDGFRVTANVRPNPRLPEWFDIELTVERVAPTTAAVQEAVFHLHPTFNPARQQRRFEANDKAKLELTAYGAFTVGVDVEQRSGPPIQLELDLAALEDAPLLFRSR